MFRKLLNTTVSHWLQMSDAGVGTSLLTRRRGVRTSKARTVTQGSGTLANGFSAYQSRISVANSQALYREHERHDISLTDALTHISSGDLAVALNDPSYIDMGFRPVVVHGELLAHHGTMIFETRADGLKICRIQISLSQTQTLRDNLVRKMFQKKYRAFFRGITMSQGCTGLSDNRV